MTLPLEAVAGRCLVMDSYWFARGRPKAPRFREDDLFVCELRVDKSQRFFEKTSASKGRYFFNSAPYVFEVFEKPLKLTRSFTVRPVCYLFMQYGEVFFPFLAIRDASK